MSIFGHHRTIATAVVVVAAVVTTMTTRTAAAAAGGVGGGGCTAFVTPSSQARSTTACRKHYQSASAFFTSLDHRSSSSHQQPSSLTRMHFFGRGDKEKSAAENTSDKDENKSTNEGEGQSLGGIFSSFLKNRKDTPVEENATENTTTAAAATETATETTTTTAVAPSEPAPTPSAPSPPPKKKEKVELSPLEQAQQLRAQAEKARLEAERMDAELTLQKIARLERELKHEKAKKQRNREKDDDYDKDDDDDDDSSSKAVQDLQREMEALQARMRGETPKPATAPPSSSSSSSSSSTLTPEATTKTTSTTSTSSTISSSTTAWGEPKYSSTSTPIPGSISPKELEQFHKNWDSIPDFIKRTMAAGVGLLESSSSDDEDDDVDDKTLTTVVMPTKTKKSGVATKLEDVNATEVAIRTDKMERLDFSFFDMEKPTFTKAQIDATKAKMQDGWFASSGLDPRLKDAVTQNKTEAALVCLEYDYFMEKLDQQVQGIVDTWMEDEWIGGIIDEFNKSAVDTAIETLYPKCTRKEPKEGELASANLPTMAQVQQFATQVLPKANFATTSKPEPVAGGYVIRGKISNENKITNGDDLITAIDEQLAKTNLADKMTVVYTQDFTVMAEIDNMLDDMDQNGDDNINIGSVDLLDIGGAQPVLYVMGADICREPRKVLLSLTTAAGLATSWYLSIYPFLLNPTVAKRVDEQLALADANMTPDLAWLTDLSIPLFSTFVGIMLCHEAGHRLVAAFNGIKPTFPTFVPSIITGVTSTVTTFKEPPKNKQALFDFSLAGPLFGMLASIAALAVGSQLTQTSDPSLLPALPLEILRQSSLGGGMIDSILPGVLNVPDGAQGTQALAGMTISLHPVAVAGYLGLVVNALSVLPIGTTDGGRMALSLFGRGTKLIIGNTFFFATLLIGTLGSDLFLFYFAFCLAFQSGNEIPARNEVDSVDFSRVIVGTAVYVLALLALIPI